MTTLHSFWKSTSGIFKCEFRDLLSYNFTNKTTSTIHTTISTLQLP